MKVEKLQFRPAEKGFILVATNDGLPTMRRLVQAYTGADNKKYIKLNGEIIPLLPSHCYMAGH